MLWSAVRWILPVLLILRVLPVQAHEEAACPQLNGGESLHCVATQAGWFYAGNKSVATTMAQAAAQAGELFQRHFAAEAPFGAVIARRERTIAADELLTLREAGAGWILPWLDQEAQQQLLETGVRRAIVAQLGDDVDEAIIERAIAQAIAQRSGSGGDDGIGALRHELGHLMLISTFWPRDAQSEIRRTGEHQYGGAGPDWLDEVAAILMETEALTQRRRARLRALHEAHEGLLPLPEFLMADHPLAGLLDTFRSEDGKARVTVLSGDAQAARLAAKGEAFYAQARGFADFLLARSGNPAIFGELARALADGSSVEDWLALHGTRHDLGDSVAELSAFWQDWLDAISRAAP